MSPRQGVLFCLQVGAGGRTKHRRCGCYHLLILLMVSCIRDGVASCIYIIREDHPSWVEIGALFSESLAARQVVEQRATAVGPAPERVAGMLVGSLVPGRWAIDPSPRREIEASRPSTLSGCPLLYRSTSRARVCAAVHRRVLYASGLLITAMCTFPTPTHRFSLQPAFPARGETKTLKQQNRFCIQTSWQGLRCQNRTNLCPCVAVEFNVFNFNPHTQQYTRGTAQHLSRAHTRCRGT